MGIGWPDLQRSCKGFRAFLNVSNISSYHSLFRKSFFHLVDMSVKRVIKENFKKVQNIKERENSLQNIAQKVF